MFTSFKKHNSGYTLLFAVLTASLVLGVATFILGIARKQYILSSTARDSMYSFYAADSGMDCVAKEAVSGLLLSTTTGSMTCGGQTKTINFTKLAGGPFGTSPNLYEVNKANFSLGFAYIDGDPALNLTKLWGCSIISVEQRTYFNSPQDILLTVVQSRGYNLCKYVADAGNINGGEFIPDASSPRTVERALQWSIQNQ